MADTSEHFAKGLKAQTMFQYGNDAALKNNLDYAIDMYRNALKLDQGNLLYRQALRGVQRRKFHNEPDKVGRMVGLKTQPMKAGLKATRARGKHEDVLEGCEDVFRVNPWDVGAAEYAADAAEALGFPKLAQWLLESVILQAGKDAGFFKHLARVYEMNQEWDRASGCWQKVKAFEPSNEEARRKINSLSASAAITRSGLGAALDRHTAEDTTMAAEALAEAAAEAEELRKPVLTAEQRLEKEIEAEPERVGLYLQLADLHKLHHRLDDAEKVLSRGRKVAPADEVLKSAHGDVQIARLRRAADSWAKKLREEPSNREAEEKLEAIREKLSAYELAEIRRRAELHPEDAALQLKFGRLLAEGGRHDEAIAAFQKARSDPEKKPHALHLAGLSFEAKGLAKLAEKNFAEALALAGPADPKLKNALRYRLGRVCEAQGKLKEAEDFYNEVAAEDYTYLDVAKRLQDLNSRDDS